MIACNIRGKAILLLQRDFVDLTARLMSDLDPLDAAAFKMAVAKNLAIGRAKAQHQKWERTFRDRLIAEMKAGRFNPIYDLESAAVWEYIEDFLEGFRYSYRSINYAVGDIHDGSDEIINISLRRKQSFLDKVLNRYGASYGEINVLKGDIRRLSGSSLDFTIFASRAAYRFSQEGVRSV